MPSLLAGLKPVPMPPTPEPMLCTLVAEPFDDPAWLFEPKLDGLRVLCRYDGESLSLISRNNKPQNSFFPDVAGPLQQALETPVILDGEIICIDAQGQSSFRALQQRFHLTNPAEVRARVVEHPAYMYLFDILYAERYSLTELPLEQRKPILRAAVNWSERVRYTEGFPEKGRQLFGEACRQGSEGIVAKHLRSLYLSGRSGDWLKIKCGQRQELVIGGFTDPQRTRVGLGALLVGYYENGDFVYAGKVGTGFNTETLRDLRERLEAIETRVSPFQKNDPPRGPGVHWARPQLVAEIAFGEWTQNGLLRQPRFEGLRMDKKPAAVRRERPKAEAPSNAARKSARRAGRSASRSPVPREAKRGTRAKAAGRAANSASRRTKAKPPVAPERPGRSDASKRASKPGGSRSAPLADYARKRDFTITAEPSGAAGARAKQPRSATKEPIFVIHDHHASHHHYDLRLEADGVLKSWAVPKEPTMDPDVKRLAIEVEDHPLAYATFTGRIPEGQYGAGTVAIFDHGTYTHLKNRRPSDEPVSDSIAGGRLEFELHGKKLSGPFALIRIRGRGSKPNWLFMKLRDQPPMRVIDARTSAATEPPARVAEPRLGTPIRPVAAPDSPDPPPARVPFTHQDKIMFPDAGFTKGDILMFYQRIAPWLLPELQDRPATLERLPDGLEGPRFWQKNLPSSTPSWIPRIQIPTETGKTVSYVLVNNEQTLLYLVNQGALTFHTWLSRVEDLGHPDFVLFDLDPGSAAFAGVVKTAKLIHGALEEQGREDALLKTSGKSGLHIRVPWRDAGGFDEARAWAVSIAQRIAADHADMATMERTKAKREGRVYIDVMQNAKGLHIVPPYVLRAVPEATVSTPLDWSELTPKLNPKKFTIKTVFRRLKSFSGG
jgi:bifunctional non-homologous end joining protein LigD